MNKITVEHLKNEANSEHTYFTEFALAYNNSIKRLYCFYEGYDDTKYYSIRIKNITLINDYQRFYCDGKDNTLNALELIKQHKEYDLSRILFFVDKDFSKRLEIDHVYCTSVYSVENYYTNKDVLKTILTEEFKVNNNDHSNNDFQRAIDLFEKLIQEFHNETKYFNAWLACQNDIRDEKGEKKRLNIDNKVKRYFKKIVNVDLQGISDFSDLNNKSEIEDIFLGAYKIGDKEIALKLDEFKKLNYCDHFRGKFELKFFISFLDRIKNELGKRDSSIFSKRYKINLDIGFSSAISLLSQYALTPACLIEYLEKYKNAA